MESHQPSLINLFSMKVFFGENEFEDCSISE